MKKIIKAFFCIALVSGISAGEAFGQGRFIGEGDMGLSVTGGYAATGQATGPSAGAMFTVLGNIDFGMYFSRVSAEDDDETITILAPFVSYWPIKELDGRAFNLNLLVLYEYSGMPVHLGSVSGAVLIGLGLSRTVLEYPSWSLVPELSFEHSPFNPITGRQLRTVAVKFAMPFQVNNRMTAVVEPGIAANEDIMTALISVSIVLSRRDR